MTMQPHHEHDAFPDDPIHALEDALRNARAATHSKRLDTANQAALAAIAQFGHAAVAAMRHLERRADARVPETLRPQIVRGKEY